MSISSALCFKSKIQIYNGNPFVLVNRERARALKSDWRRPIPVLVQINGLPNPPWRINMMPIGNGSFYLYLHGYVRKASSTKVGDMVDVNLQFDSSYKNGPAHPMPKWFSTSLAKNKKAQQAWEELIPSRKKEILRYFSGLKSDEARERNVTRALHVLSGKEGRFMARSWKNGK